MRNRARGLALESSACICGGSCCRYVCGISLHLTWIRCIRTAYMFIFETNFWCLPLPSVKSFANMHSCSSSGINHYSFVAIFMRANFPSIYDLLRCILAKLCIPGTPWRNCDVTLGIVPDFKLKPITHTDKRSKTHYDSKPFCIQVYRFTITHYTPKKKKFTNTMSPPPSFIHNARYLVFVADGRHTVNVSYHIAEPIACDVSHMNIHNILAHVKLYAIFHYAHRFRRRDYARWQPERRAHSLSLSFVLLLLTR